MPKLADTVKNLPVPSDPNEPLWKGPIVSYEGGGGISFSMLSRYLCCPERFRLMTVEGLGPPEDFNVRLEYGHMWHVCEEAHAMGRDFWPALAIYGKELGKKYPTQGTQINHWCRVCALQFPIYVDWWQKHPDVKARKPVAAEKAFDVAWELDSGRKVHLLGMIDSLDILTNEGLFIQENKTKGDIDEGMMKRNLAFDLQTGIYMSAVQVLLNKGAFGKITHDIAGVRYNVVRRPLAGGKGSIRQKKPTKKNPQGQSLEEFYDELSGVIRGAMDVDNTHYFFKRWKVNLHPGDLQKLAHHCLNPILENLCDDYEWWEWCFEQGKDPFDYILRGKIFPEHRLRHFRYPYGVYNAILEGGSSEVDEYLLTGSKLGLVRRERLFSELEGKEFIKG